MSLRRVTKQSLPVAPPNENCEIKLAPGWFGFFRGGVHTCPSFSACWEKLDLLQRPDERRSIAQATDGMQLPRQVERERGGALLF